MPEARPAAPTPRAAVGCLIALVVVGAVLLGLALADWTGHRLGVTVTVTLALLAAIAFAPRSRAAPTDRIVTPLAFLLALLVSAYVALAETSRVVASPFRGSFDDLELAGGLLFFAPIFTVALTAVGAILGKQVAASGPRGGDALRAAAWVATVATAASLALAATHAQRPGPQGYVASLPVTFTLPGGDLTRPWTPEERGAGTIVAREIVGDGCVPWPMTKVGEDRRHHRPALLEDLGFDGCGAITGRTDDARGVLVMTDQGGHMLTFHDAALTPLYPRHLRGALRVPEAFVALAALGLAVALLALLLPRRSALPLDGDACRDAEAFADGTVRLAGETARLPLPAGAQAPTGPVVAVLDTRAESFRAHAGPAVLQVVAGTLAAHRRAEGRARYAFALAFVAVAAAPLLVATILYG
jgi:hypothetical protein